MSRNQFWFGMVSLAAMVGVFQARAQASVITLTNSSFETNVVAASDTAPTASSTVQGWVNYGGAGVSATWRPTSNAFSSVPDGSQCLWIAGDPNFIQPTSVTIAPDMLYTLTVGVGSALNGGSYSGYEIYLACLHGDVTNSGSVTANTGLFTDKAVTLDTTDPLNADFIGDTLVINFSGDDVAYDNVRLTSAAAVPEPGTAMLLSSGAAPRPAGLHWRKWKRTR